MEEDEFRREMVAEGLSVTTWGNTPGDRYGAHTHPYRKVLCCLEGSITFHLAAGDIELTPGKRLVIELATSHSAIVGATGVRCAEAHFS
jgi:quercetin dioxygenase-like cupin family protein